MGIIGTGIANAGVASGRSNESDYTDAIFWQMHPELVGEKIRKSDPQYLRLRQDWLDARDLLIRPLLGAIDAGEDLGGESIPVSHLAPGTIPSRAEIARICELAGKEVSSRCTEIERGDRARCYIRRIQIEAACLARILKRKGLSLESLG